MEIESIGQVLPSNTAVTENSSINQEEFIRLFVAQLNNQDPLEPLNNREFLAQLAQFSALEQTRQTNENLGGMLTLGSSDQALLLLGKTVDVNVNSGTFSGVVEAVNYSSSGAQFTVKDTSGSFIDNVSLGQIKLVKN